MISPWQMPNGSSSFANFGRSRGPPASIANLCEFFGASSNRTFIRNMLKDRAEFISRFLYRLDIKETYSNPGAPPTAETIAEASASANDRVSFDAHQAAFSTLAVVIDACTAEELPLKGNGQAARNASKHPQVVALGKLPSDQRAAITVAALQGLAWMEDCRPWVNDSTFRNQIAKRVMAGIVTAVGRIKKAYSPAQLGALLQIGASLKDSDLFVLRSRGSIV